ncbi:MAG: hypothetical protein QOH35_1954 [Acidobacteriaceae bacterium]|jgi:hypothetical protein|nr:hypothetical protein [Acidobacteriaceae bacterium]
MLVGRCSWELSGRKLHPEDKKVTNSEDMYGAAPTTPGFMGIDFPALRALTTR